MARPQTRRQRARPCNPPRLPWGRRSRPLLPTKTPSVMGTVWSSCALALRTIWPEPLSRRAGRTGPPRCSRLMRKGMPPSAPGQPAFGEAGNGCLPPTAVGNYLPFSRLRSSAAPGSPRGDQWRVSSRGTIPAGDTNQEVRARRHPASPATKQHAWDADFTNGKPGDQALHEKCFPLPPALQKITTTFSLTTRLRPELNTRRFSLYVNSSRPLGANTGYSRGPANGPKRPICRRYRWCRNLPLVEGPHSARRSCRRVRRPRGRRQPLTGSPATAQALSVARRGGEPTEFALDEPGEGERRPVFVFGADDLHADRQTIRDSDVNDSRRQPAGRRGIGPDQ